MKRLSFTCGILCAGFVLGVRADEITGTGSYSVEVSEDMTWPHTVPTEGGIPYEIIFRSVAGDPESASRSCTPCLTNACVVIGKGVWATNLVSATCIMGLGGTYGGNEERVTATCVSTDTDNNEKVFTMQRSKSGYRYGATVRVAQSGAYVTAKVQQAYRQYDAASKTTSDPLGAYFYNANGAAISTVTDLDTAGVLIRDLVFTFSTDEIIMGYSAEPLTASYQLVWPGVRLSEVDLGTAQMGGTSVGSAWRTVNGWFTSYHSTDTLETYYQYNYNKYMRTMRVRFQQRDDGVYAYVVNVRKNYTTSQPPYKHSSLPNSYGETLTTTVNGSTLALRGVTATRKKYAVHRVAIASGDQTGSVPLRLVDIDLALTPAEGEVAVLPAAVSGDGRVVVADGMTCVLADQKLDVPVVVAEGATLALLATDEDEDGVAQLTAPEIVLEDGGRIALWADRRPSGVSVSEARTLTFEAPAGATSETLQVALLGEGFDGCRVSALSVEDGVVSVSVARIPCLRISVR